MSLRQNLAVKIVAGYAAVTFVVMEILCRWNPDLVMSHNMLLG